MGQHAQQGFNTLLASFIALVVVETFDTAFVAPGMRDTFVVMAAHSVQCVITSGTDGKHKAGSLHYADKALDFRSRGMALPLQQLIATQVRERLGRDYDFIAEGDHFHGEYDPKGGSR
jgi:hypothetical protein